MPKQKRRNKTKEELLLDLKKNEKFMAKMKFTKEKFFPALIEATDSVEDATIFLGSINTILMEEFLGFMKEKKFSDLNLVNKLDQKDENYEKYKALLSLFDEMNVFEAKDLIEGMKNEINLFIQEEMKNRKLDSLPTRWLDEI